MPDYQRLSVRSEHQTYHASWYRDGDTAHVVGGYGERSAKIDRHRNGESVAESLLEDLVTEWWAEVKANLPPDNMLPRNTMATGDSVVINVVQSGERTTLVWDVVVEGGTVYAVTAPGKTDLGPRRIEIDPEGADEHRGEDTPRTGTWLYCSEVVLDA